MESSDPCVSYRLPCTPLPRTYLIINFASSGFTKNKYSTPTKNYNRGTVPILHTGGLRVSAKSTVSRGHLAVFSSETSDEQVGGSIGNGSGKSLGLASGGGGLAWRDGALQNVRLGGITTLEGDLDLGGHRLLNYDVETPDFDHIEVCVSAVSGSNMARVYRWGGH